MAGSSLTSLFRAPLTGRHVLAMLLAFFLVIFAVNGVFVYVSLQSHPGVTSDDAYRKGLDHNRTLEQADRQKARGWNVTVTATDGVVRLRLFDKTGAPMTGLQVQAAARRPVHNRADTGLVLKETTPGFYSSDAVKLPVGRWELVLTVLADGLPAYRIEHSAVVR